MGAGHGRHLVKEEGCDRKQHSDTTQFTRVSETNTIDTKKKTRNSETEQMGLMPETCFTTSYCKTGQPWSSGTQTPQNRCSSVVTSVHSRETRDKGPPSSLGLSSCQMDWVEVLIHSVKFRRTSYSPGVKTPHGVLSAHICTVVCMCTWRTCTLVKGLVRSNEV